MKHLLSEALVVACVGGLVAFACNAVSPRGLKLSRNYFPTVRAPVVASNTPPVAVNTNGVSGTNTPAVTKLAVHEQKLRDLGLQVVGTEETTRLFHDPGTPQGTILFIDARDTKEYQAGHIPGAYEFFHYRPEDYLPVVLPLAQAAERIVVYCNGGECEDSQFTAVFLRESAGVPAEKIFIYAGGFEEWTKAGLPVELGERGSGVMK